jgi:hypothetical protein
MMKTIRSVILGEHRETRNPFVFGLSSDNWFIKEFDTKDLQEVKVLLEALTG